MKYLFMSRRGVGFDKVEHCGSVAVSGNGGSACAQSLPPSLEAAVCICL